MSGAMKSGVVSLLVSCTPWAVKFIKIHQKFSKLWPHKMYCQSATYLWFTVYT